MCTLYLYFFIYLDVWSCCRRSISRSTFSSTAPSTRTFVRRSCASSIARSAAVAVRPSTPAVARSATAPCRTAARTVSAAPTTPEWPSSCRARRPVAGSAPAALVQAHFSIRPFKHHRTSHPTAFHLGWRVRRGATRFAVVATSQTRRRDLRIVLIVRSRGELGHFTAHSLILSSAETRSVEVRWGEVRWDEWYELQTSDDHS